MPKMKSHRGASKRFKRTASGKVKRMHSFGYHKAEHKSPARKRRLRKITLVASGDLKRVKTVLSKVK